MISLRDALVKMEEKDRNGKPIRYDVDYIKLSTGEVVNFKGVVKAGLRHNMKEQRTMGIDILKTKERKALKIYLLKRLNGEDIFW